MQEIADWLHGLGLGQYAQSFADNGIDREVLAELTERDLESLGVLLGHRRKLLRAIARMQADVADGVSPAVVTGSEDAGERRQLTVMFCDLVDSTSLAVQLDPEDMRAMVRAYQACCVEVVSRYDGFVAQFTGDGVVVYFGYPSAHEDDAERAVRTGLDIVAAVGGLTSPTSNKLQVRVGIATGRVVVGDLIGKGSARQRAVVGETPNLAARLQTLAAPGCIVVSASTRRLVGDAFALRGLGAIDVKGFAEPVEAFVINGMASSATRFEASRAGRLTSFVGREKETAIFEECWQSASEGSGRFLLVGGEPGIGKSRFVTRFASTIPEELVERARFQCSPYHTASMLHPVIERLTRVVGATENDPPERQIDKLEAFLRLPRSEFPRAVPLLATLLSIPLTDRYPPLRLSAVQQRRQTLAYLLDQLDGMARERPLHLLFEDVHWADATTLEFLDLMLERIRHRPVLVVLTHRLEFEPPWLGMANVTQVMLERLSRKDVQGMMGWLTAGKDLPNEVAMQIAAKTDGVPLFVEELTKAVLESQMMVEEADRYRLEGRLPPLAVPMTLQDSLMARLDRLAPVREIAQVAATIGREFSYSLLSTVALRDTATLDDALEQLEAAELLFRYGTPPQARYRFKHALLRDAAYESQLMSRRQILHQRIGEALQEDAVVAASEPEVIARHFTDAGLTDQALEWWTKAAEQAFGRSAYTEAGIDYREAIALAETLPDTPAERTRRVRLYVGYGQSLHTGRSPGSREATEAYARARELAAGIPDSAERVPVYLGLWSSTVIRADVAGMCELAQSFLGELAGAPGTPAHAMAHRCHGLYRWMSGDPVAGRSHLEQAVEVLLASPPGMSDLKVDLDPTVATMLQLAWALWLVGEGEAAQAAWAKGLELIEASNHSQTIAYAHTWKGKLDAIRGDAGQALLSAGALEKALGDHDLPFWRAVSVFLEAWSRWRMDEREGGLAAMRQSLDFFAENGLTWYVLLGSMLMAEPLAQSGDSAAALAMIDQTLADIQATGLRWQEAEAWRQRAAILAARKPNDITDAERSYRHALSVARTQRARPFELRAAVGLAELYRTSGLEQAAQDLLTEVLPARGGEQGLPEVATAHRLLAEMQGALH